MSVKPHWASRKLWTVYEFVSCMQKLHEHCALHTCYYAGDSLWHQPQALNDACTGHNFYWLHEVNRGIVIFLVCMLLSIEGAHMKYSCSLSLSPLFKQYVVFWYWRASDLPNRWFQDNWYANFIHVSNRGFAQCSTHLTRWIFQNPLVSFCTARHGEHNK